MKVILALLIIANAAAHGQDSYESRIETWRHEIEAELKADNGWLTVSGLFWLKEGKSSVGSGPDNTIVVPAPAARRIGVFELDQNKVTLRIAKDVRATADGKPVHELSLTATTEKASIPVIVGDLTFILLKRGGRYAVRLKDQNSAARKEFKGLSWYPVKDSYRVRASLEPYNELRSVPIVNILGDTENYKSPGLLRFKLNGEEYTLEPVMEDEKLFIIFSDLTTNKTTYGSGRFLYAEMPHQTIATIA